MPKFFSMLRSILSSMPGPNLYKEAGYSVGVLGRIGLRYREAGRSVFVDSEILSTQTRMVAHRGSIKRWDPSNELDALDEADRDRIIQNMRHAFESRRYSLQPAD
jgi:hypothetical protein